MVNTTQEYKFVLVSSSFMVEGINTCIFGISMVSTKVNMLSIFES